MGRGTRSGETPEGDALDIGGEADRLERRLHGKSPAYTAAYLDSYFDTRPLWRRLLDWLTGLGKRRAVP